MLMLLPFGADALSVKDRYKFNRALTESGYGAGEASSILNAVMSAMQDDGSANPRQAFMTAAVLLEQLDRLAVGDTKVYGALLQYTGVAAFRAGYPSYALGYGLRAYEYWKHYPEAGEYVRSMANLVCYYTELRDFPKSREWIARAYAATQGRKKLRGVEAELRNNEALLAHFEGNHKEAIRLGRELLKDFPTDLYRENLQAYLKADGRYDEAIELERKRIAEAEAAGDTSSLQYARMLNGHAATLYDSGSGDTDRMIELTRRAEALFKSQKRTLSGEFATLLGNLAIYYDRKGDIANAIACARRAQNIINELKDNAGFTVAMRNRKQLAALLFKSGDYAGAAVEAAAFCAVDMENTVYTMIASKKEVRDRVWQSSSHWYLNFMPLLAMYSGDASTAGLAYNSLLLGKGLLLNAEKSTAAYAESGGETTRRLYGRWEAARAAASGAFVPSEAEKAGREALRAEQELMDALLQLPGMRREFSHDWREVAARLAPGEATAEMAEVTLPDGSNRFVAFVVTAGCDAPAVVPLADSETLAAAYEESSTDASLWELAMRPVVEAAPGVRRIYFSPSGLLHFVPLESLGGAGAPEMARLSSTRELLKERRSAAEPVKAALFGGIDYASAARPAADTADTTASHTYESGLRALREGDFAIDSLPGTRREVNAISSILGPGQAELYTDSAATEGAVRAAAGSGANTLHLSTHGFYCTPDEASSATWSALQTDGKSGADEALNRTGLFMAGAARSLSQSSQPTTPSADGILTAAEIADMQLGGFDLVVLSACETGLGDLSGDGVFGLQRGLKKAGARTLMMSLWKVADDATSELMTAFYRSISAGDRPSVALERAKEAVRSHPQWRSPEYWAAFVLLDAE